MWCTRSLRARVSNKFGILRKTSIDLYVFLTIFALTSVYLPADLVWTSFNAIKAFTHEYTVSLWGQKKENCHITLTCASQMPTTSLLVLAQTIER